MDKRSKISPTQLCNLPRIAESSSDHEDIKVESTANSESVPSQNGLEKERNDEDMVFWVRLKEGDIEALGKLYDSYIDVLFSYGLSLVPNKVLVMDSIHDLFLDLFKYRNKLAASPQVKFYLLKSLKRKVFKKGKVVEADIESMHDSSLLRNGMCELSSEIKLIAYENDIGKKKQIKLAIENLPLKQKRAVNLKFYEGRTYEEIAVNMNITIETARTLIYRSVTSLRKKMAGIYGLLFWLLLA